MFGRGTGNYYTPGGGNLGKVGVAYGSRGAQAIGGGLGVLSPTLGVARAERAAFGVYATSPITTAVLAFNHRFNYGRNLLAQATNLTTTSGFWALNGATISDLTTQYRLTESATLAAHCLYHTIAEDEVADATSGRATVDFWAKAETASHCWVGFRQNSVLYSAFVNLSTGAPVSGGLGSSMVSVTVTDASAELGAGWWRIRAVGLPTGVNTVVAIGVSDGTNQTQYTGTSKSILLKRAQAHQGDTDIPWFDPGDRTTVEDLAGAHDMALSTHGPDQFKIDRATFDGSSQYGVIPDFAYQGSSWSYEAFIGALSGSGERVLCSHWQQSSGNQRAWIVGINSSAQLFVQLSAAGSSLTKHYASSLTLDGGDLLSVTWDGPSGTLRLYVNGVEDAAVTKLTDTAMSATFDANVSLLSGAREPNGPTGYFAGEVIEHWFYEGIRTPSEILALATDLGVAGSGGGELTYDDWKARVAPSGTLYVVNKFHGSASDANPGTLASPWLTIQHALDTVTNPADSIWIVGGSGVDDRYYPSSKLVPMASGSAATDAGRIWLVGDPSNRPMIDGSVPLSVTWTSQGNGVWRAPVSITAPGYIKSNSYHGRCAEPPLLYENIWEQIQIVHRPSSGNDYALHALNWPEGSNPVAANFSPGDFYAEGASHTAPTHIWVRLPGDLNPNSESMRWVDKAILFDWETANENDGRDYIGMANLDWAYGAGAQTQKDAIVIVRGQGWRLEKCSFRDGNVNGVAIRGEGHHLYNCQALRNGCCNFRPVGDATDGDIYDITLERCYSWYANSKGYDDSWEAAGAKITNSNDVGTAGNGVKFIQCYFGYNGTEYTWTGRGRKCPGVWYDVDNKNGEVKECFIEKWGKGGVFQEDNTKNEFLVYDNVFYGGSLSSSGCAGSSQGPAFRIQAASEGRYLRNTIYRCEDMAAHLKGSDNRANNHAHTFGSNLFVENGQVGGSLGDHEISIEEDTNGPNFLISNTFNSNVWRPKTGNNPFRNQTAGVETSSTTTWYTWVSGSGDTVVTSGQVLEDVSSPFGFMPIEPYLSAGKGAQITHPLLFSTYWTVPRFAQPV